MLICTGVYEIGVHIADVGYFIEAGSALDFEASRRATSVYLVQKVCHDISVICKGNFVCRSFRCYLVCYVNTYVVSILMRYVIAYIVCVVTSQTVYY